MIRLSFSRVLGVVLRYLYLQFREFFRIAEAIYWPLFDLLLWGFAGVWMQSGGQEFVLTKIVCGMTLWQVFYRNNLEISTNILEEIWEKNMVNLFSTPLLLPEWILGLIILSLLRSGITIFICSIAAYCIFGVNIFFAGLQSVLWILLLSFSGWISGLFGGALIITLGRQGLSIPWMVAWLWAPLSGALFPPDILPAWMQKISHCLPMTYVFENMRSAIATGQTHYEQLFISLLLNVVYLIAVLVLFSFVFRRTKENGLARVG